MNTLLTSLYILIGTYTADESRGIYVFGFDPDTARTEYVGMAPVENPSYITSLGDAVYAVSENGDGTDHVSAFRFADGHLTFLNAAPTGGSPCNVATNGHLVVTANYGGGDISVFGVRGDGSLGEASEDESLGEAGLAAPRQTLTARGGGPTRDVSHIHCVKFSPDGRYLFTADLGTDRIARWALTNGGRAIDPTSCVTFAVPEGAGPRHFIFAGDSVYLICELSGEVVVFDYNGGALRLRQTVDADPADGGGSADIAISSDERHLYASNRLKNDGISVFDVGGQGSAPDEKLTQTGYKTTADHPRNLALSPDGRFLLVSCRDSDVVQIFAVDEKTGALTPTTFAIDIDAPVCVHFIELQR